MGQLFSRLVVASGLVTLACATAVEEGPPVADQLGQGTSGTANNTAGTLAGAGNTMGSAGTSSVAGTTSASGGKGGSGPSASGGTATSGGTTTSGGTATSGGNGGSGKGGAATGGASAGSSSGGKAGTASGGSGTAGSTTGGMASAGTASGGSGTAGSTGATCNGVPDWTSKTYALGDTVASTCSGVFAGGCTIGQSHKFECNPTAGTAALPWCMSREPGVGNGWGEAWVDKGPCQ